MLIGSKTLAIGCVALCVAAATALESSGPETQITAVKSQPYAGHLRIVVVASGKVEYRADRAHNPERILFDLSGIAAPALNGAALAINLGPVKRVRVATHDATTTRLVVDTDQELQYTAKFALDPPRVEIDIPIREAKDSSPAAMIPRTPPAVTAGMQRAGEATAANAKMATTDLTRAAAEPKTTSPITAPKGPASTKSGAVPSDLQGAAAQSDKHGGVPPASGSMQQISPKQGLAVLDQQGAPLDQNIRIAAFAKLDKKPADAAAAVATYRKLAESGNADSQYRLANAYAQGSGVQKDYAEAAKWYRKAAEQGHVVAQNDLGVMYANGWGVPRSEEDAWKWFLTSAAHGYVGAQSNVGAMYLNGRNDAEAVRWMQKAAAGGVPEAQYSLGTLYANGRGVPRDSAVAMQWFRKAAEQAFAPAQLALGKMYLATGPAQNYEQALTWLRQAAEAGLPEGQYRVGEIYLNGWGVHEDDAEGASWMRKAAKSGVVDAQLRMAEMLRVGKGFARDLVSAYAWYAVAGAAGSEAAKSELNTLAPQMTMQQIADAQHLAMVMVSNQIHPQTQGVAPVDK